MFNSVIEAPPAWKVGKLKSGAGLSVLAHAVGIAVVAFISSRPPPEKVISKEPTIVFAPRPPKGNPMPAASAAAPPPVVKPKKRAMAPPSVIKPLPVDPPPAVASATNQPVDPSLPFIEGSDPTGVAVGGVPHAAPGPGPSGGGDDVVSFGEGMVAPRLLSGREIQYTREAREARVQGMLIARCTVTRDGEIRDCQVIKGLPLMTDTVISALQTRRYTPVMFQGQPVSVKYVFNVKLQMP